MSTAAAEEVRWTAEELLRLGGPDPWVATVIAPGGFADGVLPRDPVIAQALRERVGRLVRGADGLLASAERLDGLACRARWTARAYRAADEAAAGSVEVARAALGGVVGRVGSLLVPPPLAAPGLPPAGAPGLPPAGPPAGLLVAGMVAAGGAGLGAPFASAGPLESAMGAVPWVLAGSTGERPADMAGAAATLLRWSRSTPWLHGSPGVRLTRRPVTADELAELGGPGGGAGRAGPGVSGAGSAPDDAGRALTAAMTALEVAQRGGRSVVVERLTTPDGRRSWVVAVPGVRSWDPTAGDDPYDVTSAVEAMSARRTVPGRAVDRALAEAGARPDEPVLLAGHSLGGMVVTGLAADPVFRSRYRVTHVVTAGSPVGRIRVPRSVSVLSLEHREDPVPALDGSRNPDRARWTTVRANGSALAARGRGGYGGHGLADYRRTAGKVLTIARSDPALLDGWASSADVFVPRRPGSELRAWRVEVSRADGQRVP